MTYKYRKVDDISTNRFNVWVPSDDSALYDSVNSNRALNTILKKGSYFDAFFEPGHLDMIHIVMIPGLKQPAVVNHRLISLRPDFLVFSKVETAEMAKGSAVAMLNALSKHFFRCVVSPKGWEDFWLADSLALYLQYALLNDTFQDPYFPEMFITDVQRPAMRGSLLEVNPKIIDPSILITDAIHPPSYQGASILKMLEVLSNQEEVLEDFYNYFKANKYSNVDTQNFLNFMSHGSFFKELNSYGKQLSPITDNWLHKIGYPYITNVAIISDGFTVTQDTFFGSKASFAPWVIPFIYQDSFEVNGTLQWLSGEKSYTFKDLNIGSWIQLNKNSRGMFRVSYGSSLKLLLVDNVYWSLAGSERGALIDDAFELSKMKNVGVDLGSVLELSEKLADETDYVSFSIAINHLNTLRQLYGQKGLGLDFERKVGDILGSIFSKVSWIKKEPVSFGKTMWTRSVVESACQYNIASCLAKAGSVLPLKILGDLIPTVNCYQVWKSKQSDWNTYFLKLYNKKDSQYARADALYALACSDNLQIGENTAISEYLKTINSDAILTEDALRAFKYIYSRPLHLNQTFEFIIANFSTLLTTFEDDFMASLISEISQFLLPKYYSSPLDKLKSTIPHSSKTYKAIIKAQKDMKSREEFVDDNMKQVINWLQNNSTTFRPLPPPTIIPTQPTNVPPTHKNSSIIFNLNMFSLILGFIAPFLHFLLY